MLFAVRATRVGQLLAVVAAAAVLSAAAVVAFVAVAVAELPQHASRTRLGAPSGRGVTSAGAPIVGAALERGERRRCGQDAAQPSPTRMALRGQRAKAHRRPRGRSWRAASRRAWRSSRPARRDAGTAPASLGASHTNSRPVGASTARWARLRCPPLALRGSARFPARPLEQVDVARLLRRSRRWARSCRAAARGVRSACGLGEGQRWSSGIWLLSMARRCGW
jgi:hypothetical protein